MPRVAEVVWCTTISSTLTSTRLSGAGLIPGDGFNELFGSEHGDDIFYSVLGNLVLVY